MIPRLLITGALAALAALIGTGPAAAAVTVGQVAPGTITSCSKSFDFLQAATPDNSYAMPAAGLITSWTHRSQAGAGQAPTLKIFRKVSDPVTYQQVGHDGPHPIDPNTTKTFPSSVAVKAGDVLGLTGAGGTVNIGCLFSGPGDDGFRTPSLLNDGDVGDFSIGGPTHRLNVSAVLEPTNTFALGTATRHKKKGTATLALNFPNPGELTVTGIGFKTTGVASASSAVSAGETFLLIKATGKKRKTLKAKGKVKLNLTIGYTPTGGEPSSQSMRVKLRKK